MNFKNLEYLLFLKKLQHIFLYCLFMFVRVFRNYFNFLDSKSKNFAFRNISKQWNTFFINDKIFLNLTKPHLFLNKPYYINMFLNEAYSNLYYYFYMTKSNSIRYNNLLSYSSFLGLD